MDGKCERARILVESGPLKNQSLEGARLSASLSRMHRVLLLAILQGSLRGKQMLGVRLTAIAPDQGHRGHAHERTQSRDG
jgi:hypothetical protein